MTSKQKPPAAAGHITALYKDLVLVWGGYTVSIGEDVVEQLYIPGECLFVYHSELDVWHCFETTQDVPPGTSGGGGVIIKEFLYITGGHTYYGYSNNLYQLNLISKEWKYIDMMSNDCFSPRDKFAYWEYNDSLYIFGGFGLPLEGYLHNFGYFTEDSSTLVNGYSRGWNNQIMSCNVNDAVPQWKDLQTTGCLPSPRAAHATVCLHNIVYLFGGRHGDQRLNDLYTLNLDTLQWTRLHTASDGPSGRSWHSLTRYSSCDLLLYGGFSQNEEVLGDCWVFDTTAMRWQNIHAPSGVSPRLWHSACYCNNNDVVIFGGCCNNILSKTMPNDLSDSVFIIRHLPQTLLRICLNLVFKHKSILKSEWPHLPHNLFQFLITKLNFLEEST